MRLALIVMAMLAFTLSFAFDCSKFRKCEAEVRAFDKENKLTTSVVSVLDMKTLKAK